MTLSDTNLYIQIITNIFVIIAGFIAIRQYLLSVKNTQKALEKDLEMHEKEIYQRDKEKIFQAIELAKYYKDDILPLMRKLKKIFMDIGIYDITKSIDKINMIDFDIIELEKNLSKSQIEQIQVSGADYHLSTVVQEQGIAYNISYNKDDNGTDNDVKSDTKKDSMDNLDNIDNFGNMIMNILNSLEYFSMHFVHNTADHTVVYQPLHMTFLEVVRMLYYNISSINTKGEQKFYINTIILFKKWTKISIQQEKEENDAMRSAANIGKILKDNESIDIDI